MRVIELLKPRRGTVPITIVAVLAAALAAALVLTSRSSAHRQVNVRVCPPGLTKPDYAAGEGRRACVPLGGPETFQDLFTANSQIAARETAPFTSSAAGAYMHAYAQRQAMAAADASNENYPWQPVGTPPLCAAQTTASTACPAAGAENGNYSNVGSLGFHTLSGRISSFAYDPTTQGHYFASPTVGGVWETRDGGATWQSIGDSLPTQAVGAIAYDAPLHRIIVGTGDNSFGGTGITGHGVYYSGDDGATWTMASGIPDGALSFKVVVSPADSSGNTVYAALSKGLFRSGNGGDSFVNEKLPTSPTGYVPNCAGDTTTGLCFFANVVTDVVVKAKATSNGPKGAVLAVVGWRAGQTVDNDPTGSPVKGCTLSGAATNCLQAPQNGLYESSTGDPGSFKFLPGGSGGPTGFAPNNVVGRTALAIAHGQGQNPDAVYALVEDAQKFQKCQDVLDAVSPTCNANVQGVAVSTVLDGMYASYDFGQTWTKIMDFTQLRQPGTNSSIGSQAEYSPGIQAWYNLWVEADPTATDSTTGNPTRVLFGLEEVWENNPTLQSAPVLTSPYPAFPGGTPATDPWVVIGRYWNACPVGPFGVGGIGPCNPNPFTSGPIAGSTTHPDQHAYAMIPDGKGGVTLLVGSDGGAYKQHVDSGKTFSNDSWGDGLNRSMSALQPYDANMSKDGTVVSGLQDNGEMKISPNGHEAEIYGGDGFYTTIDPGNSKNIIEEYTYAQQVNLTNDGGASWFPIQPSACGTSTTALFATPMEQDPTTAGHVLLGCTQIQEATNVFANPCAVPPGASSSNCQAANVPFNTVFDLSTLPSPNSAPNIPSALAVRGANEYVAYCGYCDPATQKIPFANGIATNVGGSKPPKIGAGDGWHQAKALCSGCQTANGKLPERYINSIQEDPSDPNTVYVTLGGYGRRWIPPGSFGEDTGNVGVGHVFVSHDHGDNFTDISGNLPDITANYTAIHDGKLLVATDLGVYVDTSSGSGTPTYAPLGAGLPAAPVFTIRQSPANANEYLISTYGRGDWLYNFAPTPSQVTQQIGTITHGGSLCTSPIGRLQGKTLGPFTLGDTRAKARQAARLINVQFFGFDDFCLKGGPGIRVGYPSSKLLRSVARGLRAKIAGKVVIALTANRFYALDGVRPGARVGRVARRLHISAKRFFAVGLNDWYLVPGGAALGVLKVRGGVIQEIGIADQRLLRSHKARMRFFTSFRRA